MSILISATWNNYQHVYGQLAIIWKFRRKIFLVSMKSDTIVYAIKDILLRSGLSLENCRGQTYDDASNMMGKKSGVATQIQKDQPKAIITHCHGHSLLVWQLKI